MFHALATSFVRLGAALACGAALTLRAAAADYPLPAPGDNLIGELRVTLARADETLLDIARRHDLGFNEIAAANPGIDPWLPGADARVVLPTQFVLPPGARTGIVINLAQMRLFYFPDRSPRVITHPLGVAAEFGATPLGSTSVVRKAVDPPWRPPQSIRAARAAAGEILPQVVPPGPNNPLGRHALYLGFAGYLVHGTNRPWGIGMRVSGGCIRLYPEDIESLYPEVPVGTPVRIVDGPFAVGLRNRAPYVQVFAQPDRAASGRTYTPLVEALLRVAPNTTLDWDRVLRAAKEQRALPVPVGKGAPTLEQVIAGAALAGPVDARDAR
jgi:L,D-transpeptidase ErfK/SrfK